MSVTLRQGDMLQVIPQLVAEGVVVDAVVTDPPYHLTATVKRFGAANSAPAQYGRDGAMARLSGGFMSQQWDGGDIAFRPETWATVATVMRPGAFLLAFGGTRTYHRLACAIEDAGFVIQDCLMWLFATGFPKRRDMLKPAYEPLVLAYKPGGKRELSIDECRIGTGDDKGIWPVTDRQRAERGWGMAPIPTTAVGRWPANLCHDGSDEVVGMFPQTASRKDISIKKSSGAENDGNIGPTYGKENRPAGSVMVGYGDEGSAARFFFSSKAGAIDRFGSRHPTVKPVELMKWLVQLVTPPNGICLDPFAGSGTTGVAALATGRGCILIEREEQYCNDIRDRLAFYEGGGAHSVKTKNRNRKVDHGPLFAEFAE